MKRFCAAALVAAMFLTSAVCLAGSGGRRPEKGIATQRTTFRSYSGATPLQYDTLNAGSVGDHFRVTVYGLTAFGDDSAAGTPTLNVYFVSSVSKRVYLKLVGTAYTAGAQRVDTWTGPWTFPPDSTILIQYNLTGGSPVTLDTLMVNATYQVQEQ